MTDREAAISEAAGILARERYPDRDTLQTAFVYGFLAAFRGHTMSACPYFRAERGAWQAGFDAFHARERGES